MADGEPTSAPPPSSAASARGMTLARKLVAVGCLFLFLALGSIGLTMSVTWQLEGGAAAINEAGRMRMRSYQLALNVRDHESGARAGAADEVRQHVRELDASMQLLKRGDPQRPLSVPQTAQARARYEEVAQRWAGLRAEVLRRAGHPPGAAATPLAVDDLVEHIDALVSSIEQHLSVRTSALHTFQIAMMVLAVLSAIAILYTGHVVVLAPVARLREALARVEAGDFAERVQVTSRDELGDLAEGFNHMAERLQALYGTLESKVREKTARLEVKQQRLSALYEVSTFVATAETLQGLSQGFAQRMRQIAQADAVAIRWSDEANERYLLLASDCLPEVLAAEEQCVLTGDCLCGARVVPGTPLRLRVIPIRDERPKAGAEQAALSRHCQRAGYQTLVTVPLSLHHRVLGEIELFYRGDVALSDEDRGLFEALASHLAGAMESLRVTALDRESAVAGERQLLAQELHDSIAQSLAFLKIQMQLLRNAMAKGDQPRVAKALDELDAGVRESYSDVRELLLHFRVRTHTEDLQPALRETLSKFELQSGVPAELKVHGQGLPLPADVQIQVLHIVQEALSNVRKHAHASHVWVDVQTHPAWVITVRDNGRGFDAEGSAPDDTHVGLRIMRERAARIGAGLQVRSGAWGTSVELRLVNDVTGAALVPEALAPTQDTG